MRVGIISDTHDHVWNLEKAIEILKNQKVNALFHCGDLVSPFMIEILLKLEKPVHLILGNNKGDIVLLMNIIKDNSLIHFYGDRGEVLLNEKEICLVHYPDEALAFASTGKYDYVFFGHTHLFETKKIGNTLLINPGEVLGKKQKPSLVILELSTGEFEKVEF